MNKLEVSGNEFLPGYGLSVFVAVCLPGWALSFSGRYSFPDFFRITWLFESLWDTYLQL